MQVSHDHSRLVRFLSDLTGAKSEISQHHFVQRLGQLFDLADSIRIAAAQDNSPMPVVTPNRDAGELVREDFLRGRAAIVSSCIGSFAPGNRATRIRLPPIAAGASPEEAMAAEPYLAFYAAQQRDIDFKVRNLRATVRESVAAVSPGMARLCALDSALAEPLAAYSRRAFAAVPGLLETRFEQLRQQYRANLPDQQHENDAWTGYLAQFRSEMQGLLLAEVETKIQPVLGLVEALDD